jgi:hypothetical protein
MSYTNMTEAEAEAFTFTMAKANAMCRAMTNPHGNWVDAEDAYDSLVAALQQQNDKDFIGRVIEDSPGQWVLDGKFDLRMVAQVIAGERDK